jgi:uncharacterized protein YgiM (DUF1202 family)
MNRILAIGCALAVIAAPAVSFAAPLSAPQAPAAASGLELAAAITKTVARNGTQVYRQPVNVSKVLTFLDAGTKVIVLDVTADGQWDHVQVGSVTGYVRVDALK